MNDCYVVLLLCYIIFIVRNLMSPSRDIVLSCLSTESIMSDLKDAKEWV